MTEVNIIGNRKNLKKMHNIMHQFGLAAEEFPKPEISVPKLCLYFNFQEKLLFWNDGVITGPKTIKIPGQASKFLDEVIERASPKNIPSNWFYLLTDSRFGYSLYQTDKKRFITEAIEFVTSSSLTKAITTDKDFLSDFYNSHIIDPLTNKIKPFPKPPYRVRVNHWAQTIILSKQVICWDGKFCKIINEDYGQYKVYPGLYD